MYLINNLFSILALRLLYIVGYIRASFLGVRLGSGARIHLGLI